MCAYICLYVSVCLCVCVHTELPDVRTSCGVVKVVRAGPDSSPGTPAVTVTTDKGETLHFDAVVFATHR